VIKLKIQEDSYEFHLPLPESFSAGEVTYELRALDNGKIRKLSDSGRRKTGRYQLLLRE
jgi:hypothetical protein